MFPRSTHQLYIPKIVEQSKVLGLNIELPLVGKNGKIHAFPNRDMVTWVF